MLSQKLEFLTLKNITWYVLSFIQSYSCQTVCLVLASGYS